MKKSLLFLLFVSFAIASKAQVYYDAKFLKGFDEGAAYQEMEARKIPASERDGYLEYLKSLYVEKHHPEASIPKKVGNATYINLTPQVNPNCSNLDFGLNSFANWTGDTWTNSSYTQWTTTAPVWSGAMSVGAANALTTVAAARHTLMNIIGTAATNNAPWGAPLGWDEKAITVIAGQPKSDIPTVAPNGSGTSVRLGNAVTGAGSERIIYSIGPISSANAQLTFMYAVVLQDPGHSAAEQPYFNVTIKDQNGVQIPGTCGSYDVNATLASTDPNFGQAYNTSGVGFLSPTVRYRRWTTNAIDLSPYSGQTLTVEFRTADCSQSGHYGYAYIDAFCGPLQLTVSGVCPGSPSATLIAPPGFFSYQWSGPNGGGPISGAVNDTLVVAPVPATGSTFTVTMTTNNGCTTDAVVTILPSTVTVGSAVALPSCTGGTTGSVTLTPVGAVAGTSYTFTVNDGGGSTVYSGTNTAVSGLAPGIYTVSVTAGGCPNRDTTFTIPVTPITPSTSTATFCSSPTPIAATYTVVPNNTTWQWYDNTGTLIPGATSQTVTVSGATAGQVYSVTSMNSAGCRDSQLVTLNYLGPNYTISPFQACGGGNSGFAIIQHVNGSVNINPYTYTFSGPVSGSGGPVNLTASGSFTITGLTQGNYSVTIVDGSAPSCSYVSTFTISETQIPVQSAGPVYKCTGDTLNINGGIAGITHQWYYSSTTNPPLTQINPGNTQNITVNGLPEGYYTDTVTATVNGFTCLSVYQVHYVDTILIDSDLTTTNPCFHDSSGTVTVNLDYGPYLTGYNYSFGPASPIWAGCPTNTFPMNGTVNLGGQIGAINDLCAGTYTISIYKNGCLLKDTFKVTEPTQLPKDVLKTYYCKGDTIGAIMINPPINGNNTLYQWYYNQLAITGANDTVLYINDPENTYNNYTATFMLYGCLHNATLYTYEKPPALFIPEHQVNVFSPNADGVNETFHPFRMYPSVNYNNPNDQTEMKNIDYLADDYEMHIFDRWGKMVFETTDYATPWDGKHKNGKIDDGTYFYVVTYRSRCGTDADKVTVQGFVQIVR